MYNKVILGYLLIKRTTARLTVTGFIMGTVV